MISGSSRYIQALRKGDYLTFLDWPAFITQHYQGSNQETDFLIDALVFVWLHHQFSPADAERVAVFLALHEEHDTLLPAKLAYSLTILSSAAVQCMAILASGAVSALESVEGREGERLIAFIKKNSRSWRVDEGIIAAETKRFTSLIKSAHGKVGPLFQEISPLLSRRKMAQEYVSVLEAAINSSELSGNPLVFARLVCAKELLAYLDTVSTINSEAEQRISAIIRNIRLYKPEDFEELYVSYFVPLGVLDQAKSALWSFADSFFAPQRVCATTEDLVLAEKKSV